MRTRRHYQDTGVNYRQLAYSLLVDLSFPEEEWKRRVDSCGVEWMETYFWVSVLAVSDFLEPQVDIPDSPRWKRMRAVNRAKDRKTAYYWLFSNDDKELNLMNICNVMGIEVSCVREGLLKALHYLNQPE